MCGWAEHSSRINEWNGEGLGMVPSSTEVSDDWKLLLFSSDQMPAIQRHCSRRTVTRRSCKGNDRRCRWIKRQADERR